MRMQASCRQQIFKLHADKLVVIEASDIARHPAVQWLVCHTDRSRRVYLKAEVANTKATMRQLRRTQTAVERYHFKTLPSFSSECQMQAINELESWKQEYLKAVKQTRDWNLKFLKPIAHKERQKTSRLLDCPTMLRVFKAFNRDLTHMGWNDWRVIEHVVRRELKA
ncbi:hypothetical protein C8R44DRAFT_887615 [Mycena epipterygia]|nr:hypothetical protein C8R44DRAFT_887615 [Mycena epipterygia]